MRFSTIQKVHKILARNILTQSGDGKGKTVSVISTNTREYKRLLRDLDWVSSRMYIECERITVLEETTITLANIVRGFALVGKAKETLQF